MEVGWDEQKDSGNQERHGVSFAEAQTLFTSGDDYLELFDVEHSDLEGRFIAIGRIDRGLVLVVYTEREEDIIRIIGARMATNRERELYRSNMDPYR